MSFKNNDGYNNYYTPQPSFQVREQPLNGGLINQLGMNYSGRFAPNISDLDPSQGSQNKLGSMFNGFLAKPPTLYDYTKKPDQGKFILPDVSSLAPEVAPPSYNTTPMAFTGNKKYSGFDPKSSFNTLSTSPKSNEDISTADATFRTDTSSGDLLAKAGKAKLTGGIIGGIVGAGLEIWGGISQNKERNKQIDAIKKEMKGVKKDVTARAQSDIASSSSKANDVMNQFVMTDTKRDAGKAQVLTGMYDRSMGQIDSTRRNRDKTLTSIDEQLAGLQKTKYSWADGIKGLVQGGISGFTGGTGLVNQFVSSAFKDKERERLVRETDRNLGRMSVAYNRQRGGYNG